MKMIVMPANATGWFWHCLARETGRIGHLYSPGAERGPWPWLPYALDNGAFAAWDQSANVWNPKAWNTDAWRKMLRWAQAQQYQPRWAIVPDWIADYRVYIENRRAFAEKLRSSTRRPFFAETEVEGVPISERIGKFARENEMKACQPPLDLSV